MPAQGTVDPEPDFGGGGSKSLEATDVAQLSGPPQLGRASRSGDNPSQEVAQGGLCLPLASSSSQKVFRKLQPGTLDLCWRGFLESLGMVSKVKGGISTPWGQRQGVLQTPKAPMTPK